MRKEKKNIYRIFWNVSRAAKLILLLGLLLALFSHEAFCLERLQRSLDYVIKGKYKSAYKELLDYRKEFPKDALGLELNDIINKARASIHIKKSLSYLSVGDDAAAQLELDTAASFHKEYTRSIEKEYLRLAKVLGREKAVNSMILEMLKKPSPSNIDIYDFGSKLRNRIDGGDYIYEPAAFTDMKETVNRYIKKDKWRVAIEEIEKYLERYPNDIKAKEMLSETKKNAAEKAYELAVNYIDKKKDKQVVMYALESKEYDKVWFKEKLAGTLQQAKDAIKSKDLDRAIYFFAILNKMDPDNQVYSLYLKIIGSPEEGLNDWAANSYSISNFPEASILYEYLSFIKPEKKEYKFRYHISSAHRYIKSMRLDKVKEHLVAALELKPDSKEALGIFDRFQDVSELVGNQ